MFSYLHILNLHAAYTQSIIITHEFLVYRFANYNLVLRHKSVPVALLWSLVEQEGFSSPRCGSPAEVGHGSTEPCIPLMAYLL